MLGGLPGTVPGKRGVPGAVPHSLVAPATALLPALLVALLFFPALFPAVLPALFRNSSPALLYGASGFTILGVSRWSLVLERKCHDSPPAKVILSYLAVNLTTPNT